MLGDSDLFMLKTFLLTSPTIHSKHYANQRKDETNKPLSKVRKNNPQAFGGNGPLNWLELFWPLNDRSVPSKCGGPSFAALRLRMCFTPEVFTSGLLFFAHAKAMPVSSDTFVGGREVK